MESLIRRMIRESLRNSLSHFEIRPSPDDVIEVAEAHGLTVAREYDMVDVSSLLGGVDLNQTSERRRVDALKEKILSDDGYVARLIIDCDNHVLEGQHRLEALRELGMDKAPVVRLKGSDDLIPDVKSVDEVLKANGVLNSDHRHRLIEMLAGFIHEEKGNVTELREYIPPRGFETGWNAAVENIISQTSK